MKRKGAEKHLKVGLLDLKILPITPHTLSGGQQQRIGFVGLYNGLNQVILLNEPTSALDPRTSLGMFR